MQRAQLPIRALNNTLEGVSSTAVTLYDVLSVSRSVELKELKKAYREKVRVYHPDACPPAEREESSKMFLEVQEAYETLSHPMLRAEYDFNLHFNPQIMLLNRRKGNVRGGAKQQWAEQLERLNRMMGMGMERESWGGRMRRNQRIAQVRT
ncbi:hypothetical protein SUGI_0026740 [Cryptomeria japonica]|uniref:chaperone protein dnaJ 20, chloroplastic-like n=1 Tax=Cryptomeria japonica TaxID=3369 RepID=UPI002408D10A|nr:chaperone protein dnaJ 20, chloroplastic-like [Cryptomeria japonica]GLJ05853.1 hypothetical protein SUGI_0026740 [Cryptomeria japonica]